MIYPIMGVTRLVVLIYQSILPIRLVYQVNFNICNLIAVLQLSLMCRAYRVFVYVTLNVNSMKILIQ